MIRSMTGFGAATAEEGGLSARVEIRSVNHRYLQVKTRLPQELGHLEPDVEGLVRKSIDRGSVTLTISVMRDPTAAAAALNTALARRYQKDLAGLAKELGIPGGIDLRTLVGLPGVFGGGEDERERGREAKLVLRAVKEALASMVAMRGKEGASLAADLERNARSIGRITARIGKRMPEVVRGHHASLRRRLDELLDGRLAPDADLTRELALLADRMDVGEELARLASHLEQLAGLLETGGAVGRKLDFLVQELLREANTLGAKCNDASVAHAVVDLKTHIERLREQVQNVE